jgi:hypothetical protein
MRKKRPYVPGEWKRRGRVDPRSKSPKLGRPFQRFLAVTDSAERRRLHWRAWDQNPKRVARVWLYESHTRSKAEVLASESLALYSEWFETLDDELPPGIDLTAALWG